MFAQLLFTYGQYIKMGRCRVLLEWIPVLTGLKPAVDAYRVASAEIMQRGHAVNPDIEMTATSPQLRF